MTKTRVINEEKMLSEMFVLLEYSVSFKEFVDGMSPDLWTTLYGEMIRSTNASSL